MNQPTLIHTTEERYYDMLGVLPPADRTGSGFLVGEPYDHRPCRVNSTVQPTYQAFFQSGDERFFECREPMTKAEFRHYSLNDGIEAVSRTVIVTVSGGVVQNVENVPAGVTVEIRDYDVADAPAGRTDTLPRDANGDAYEYAIYRAEG